ncbi:ABC transporter permease [Anaerolineales bacterium HSG24]|nr:ABC transporter permease [Anaerolineales bacterium HSG24]
MGVIRYKIWFDLWHNKSRTIQTILIIAVGTFAVGMSMGAQQLLLDSFSQSWQSTSPGAITLIVDPPVDDEMLAVLKKIDGVAEIDGELNDESIKWRPDSSAPWQSGILRARDDYTDQKLGLFQRQSGAWPTRRKMAVEDGFDLQNGATVYIEVQEKSRPVQISGSLFDPSAVPPFFGGEETFYVTRNRFAELTGERGYRKIRVAPIQYDEATIGQLADQIQRHLEKQEIKSRGAADLYGNRTTDPAKHPFQDLVDGINMIFIIMGLLSLILGMFLVFNTMTAIISQQVNQIGIMKAIGASRSQILLVYYTSVLVYGLMALLLAVPTGALGAQGVNLFMLYMFNVPPTPFVMVGSAIQVQFLLAILMPLIAATLPILTGSMITVRKAISSYGLGGASGLLEIMLARVDFLPRTLTLSVSNTFRNKRRVFLTMLTLVGSGTIFMMVMTTQKSAAYSFDEILLETYNYNVSLDFKDNERVNKIEKVALSHPEVTHAEAWILTGGVMRIAGQDGFAADRNVFLFALPVPTSIYHPTMVSGRWLQPEDGYAVVLHQKLANELHLKVGDWVTLDNSPRGESEWRVVGLFSSTTLSTIAHMSRKTLAKELRQVGQANSVWVQTSGDEVLLEERVADGLSLRYESSTMPVKLRSLFGPREAHKMANENVEQVSAIISLLGLMALVTALVGGIALSGVISINVLERRREIGVMRAIGASSGTIGGLFMGEGIILGLLSWLISLPLSVPLGQLMTQGLGEALQFDIVYVYSQQGIWYWLMIIIPLSIMASWLPAWRATRVSVRESLSY